MSMYCMLPTYHLPVAFELFLPHETGRDFGGVEAHVKSTGV